MLRRLTPLLPALSGLEYGLRVPGIDITDIATFLAPLQEASDHELDALFAACRSACERKADEAWVSADQDLSVSDLIALVMEVVNENFTALFVMERATFKPVGVEDMEFTPALMPDGESWLWRPMVRGVCKLESYYDGTLRIEHIAKANDVFAVADENEARARKAAEKK